MTQPTTILVVDDDARNREVVELFLDEGDFLLRFACDGAIAWDLLQAEPEVFALVLLDRIMPGIDGMEVFRRMRNHPRLRSTPVIFQTARAMTAEVMEARAQGASYLTKPFGRNQLLGMIHELLAKGE